MTQEKLGKLIGGSQSTIAGYESGRSIPPTDVSLKFADLFGVTVEQLFRNDDTFIVKENDVSYGSQVKGKNIIPFEAEDHDIVMVPFYDAEASAGAGIEVSDYVGMRPIPVMRSFLAPYAPEVVRAVIIKGDSMTKIGLFDGDMAFYVPAESHGDGIYAISINNTLLVKRVEFDPMGEEIQIISENDRYKPRTLKGEEMNRLRVEGKIIGWLHKHPY